MSKFKGVSSQVDFPTLTEEILAYWKENKIFERSISERPEDKKWTFLDGPPFITGLPHYGTLLVSIPKDMFPRYWTMKGYRVRRVWGWDVHGLPAENKVEEILGIKRKKDIEEKIGVKKFIEACREYVSTSSAEWEWYIDHIGRWVDFKNSYKTMDLSYMETVMWVFKSIYDKGLIYKGLRVSLYCPHCATPISNFEVAMDSENYKDVTEPTAVYKYPLKDEKDTYILAWSTTPWNKIVTSALAVNPKLTYVKVSQGGEKYILAKSTVKMLKGAFKIVDEFKGSKLVGKKFVLHYDWYKIDPSKRAFVVIGGDFVTAEEGTGVVTLAVYGEEDLKVMQRDNIALVYHVDEEGMIIPEVPKFGGMFYLDANEKVIEDLNKRSLIYRVDDYTHNVPHCWRCATRLYFAPKDAWFVDIQKLKPKLFKNNEQVNWFPKHFKNGRFKKSMEQAPDWNISRNRYWGSPVPVWECECGERIVPGSIKELEELSGQKVLDLHKPEIDEVTIKCSKCGKETKRVPEVLDSWIEAGSASFAERHFPFNKDFALGDFFPPDFIVEYTGQIRAWFYVLHVIATALFDSNAFKNVLVTGVILGTDGRKMSKNYGNYPDPKEVLQKYGGDALRIYLLGSPVMRGEDVNFSNDGVPDATRSFLLILWNCYKYFIDYASIFGWSCEASGKQARENLTILDKWILSKLTQLVFGLTKSYESYDTVTTVKLLKEFIVNDLSTWYIRRNRERISNNRDEKDRDTALSVLYGVLVTYSKLLAPVAPFITEEMYRNLTGDVSVHLTEFPKGDKSLLDEKLIKEMEVIRKHAEAAHAKRKEKRFKLRQPLSSLATTYPGPLPSPLEDVLKNETNVQSIKYKKPSSENFKVNLDFQMTKDLIELGEAREIVRQIQNLRKEQGLTLKDKIEAHLKYWPLKYESTIKASTASVSLVKSNELGIKKVE